MPIGCADHFNEGKAAWCYAVGTACAEAAGDPARPGQAYRVRCACDCISDASALELPIGCADHFNEGKAAWCYAVGTACAAAAGDPDRAGQAYKVGCVEERSGSSSSLTPTVKPTTEYPTFAPTFAPDTTLSVGVCELSCGLCKNCCTAEGLIATTSQVGMGYDVA